MLPKEFENAGNLMKYLKSLNLQTIFDVGKTCCCIFHQDEKPSASIYQGINGDWLYFCNSSNCIYAGNALNILQLVQACQRGNKSSAFEFLKKSFNITVKLGQHSEISSENLFEENLSLLGDTLKQLAPTTFGVIDLNVLKALYRFGWESMNQIVQEGIVSHSQLATIN